MVTSYRIAVVVTVDSHGMHLVTHSCFYVPLRLGELVNDGRPDKGVNICNINIVTIQYMYMHRH